MGQLIIMTNLSGTVDRSEGIAPPLGANHQPSYRLMTVPVSEWLTGWGIESWEPLLLRGTPPVEGELSASREASSATTLASDATFEIVDMDIFDRW